MHIARHLFPCVTSFEADSHLVCSKPSCRWASHTCFKNSGCSLYVSAGVRCGSPLVEAGIVSEVPQFSTYLSKTDSSSYLTESVLLSDPTESTLVTDPLEISLLSASAGTFVGPSGMESEVLNVLMVCPVSTVSHIPRSFRPLLAHVLS